MTQKPQFSKPIKKQTLADQVAATIRESILAGEWEGGDALPTEPELAEQFGVSRAVIRDATRMLAALGLVEAQHGRGVFITESQVSAFGDALLLALRREGATVWDVEHFEQIIYPAVFALAAREASDEEIATIRQAANHALAETRSVLSRYWDTPDLPLAERDRIMAGYRDFTQVIFAATHNKVLLLLAPSLLRLRTVRYWQDEDATLEETLEMESAYFSAIVDAIASRDPDQARQTITRLMALPPEAEEVMRQTPVGNVPVIPVSPRNR